MLYSLVGILTSGMSVLLLPLLTRWMSPDEFGLLNSALAISSLAMPFVTVGLGAAVVRYFHEYSDDEERFKEFFSGAFLFQIALVIIVTVATLSLFAIGLVNTVAGIDAVYMIPVLLTMALNPPRDLGNQLLTTQEKHGRASVNQLVSFAVATSVSLWLIGAYGLGALGRLYGLSCGAGVAALMLINQREVRNKLRWALNKEELGVALKFGVPYVPHSLAMAGMFSVDKLVVQHSISLSELGVYSAAKSVALGMSFIFVALARAWYPRYFSLRDSGQNEKALRGQWSILCALPLIVVGFVILAPVVFPLLVDSRYLEGQKLLPILGAAIFTYGLFITQANYINYLKKTAWLPVIAGSGVLLNLVLSLYMTPKWGTEGAAWCTMLGYVLMVTVLMIVSLKLERRILERVILPCISILLAFLGVWISSLIPSEWMWGSRISLAALACLVALGIWFTGSMVLRGTTAN